MGAALFPLIFVPLSELSGRMSGYFVSYIILCIFLIPSALAKNFQTVAVARFFGGGASSVSINIVGGTITDLFYSAEDRSPAMACFGFTSVVGIALGPFIGWGDYNASVVALDILDSAHIVCMSCTPGPCCWWWWFF